MSHQPADGTWATSPDSRACVWGPTGPSASSQCGGSKVPGPCSVAPSADLEPCGVPPHVHVADSVLTLVGFYHATFPSVFSSLPSAQTELGKRCWHGRLDGQVGRISEPGLLHGHGRPPSSAPSRPPSCQRAGGTRCVPGPSPRRAGCWQAGPAVPSHPPPGPG